MSDRTKLRILLIQQEFTTWRIARRWSYSVQLGLEEGLNANGIEFLTITTPWLCQARDICKDKHFDQIWLEIVHTKLDDDWLQWISDLAPIRIGLIGESLEYTPEEYTFLGHLRGRRQEVENRLKYITHVVACDEKDAERINGYGLIPAMWWPQAVPERFINPDITSVNNHYAVFGGALYGERANWLRHPELKDILFYLQLPEGLVTYALFDTLHFTSSLVLNSGFTANDTLLGNYLNCLRSIRRKSFIKWLEGLQSGCAVVNLPHAVKTYAGRVVEGIAAGRPIISWEIPDRPQNKNLFEDGKEILLYPKNNPSALADCIKRILSDPDLGKRLVTNAQRKLKHFHTAEKRVSQILDWVTNEINPVYF